MLNLKKYIVSIVFGLVFLGLLQPAFAVTCKDLLGEVAFYMTANGHHATGTLWKTGSNGNIITMRGSFSLARV